VTEQALVHIVDDDADYAASLAAVLAANGRECRLYASGADFVAAAAGGATGVALVDFRMPGMDGLGLMAELARRGARLPVVVMTGYADVPLAVRAMKAGAVDFIEKPCAFETLREVLNRAMENHAPRAAMPSEAARLAGQLTPREREVFDRLVLGDANKEVARRLDISARTVEIHRARVYEKLGAKGLPDLVRLSFALNGGPPAG
jgi:two-component system response regulator FixJ